MSATANHISPLLSLAWDNDSSNLTLSLSLVLIISTFVVVGAVILVRWWLGGLAFKKFEIDQAEIGVGNNKFRFRPNMSDKQIAYAIWVELSTRKIGIAIDFEDDVVAEIYDSWFEFFSVTRELIKGVPVSKVRRDSTQAIIKLSIEVLNEGLRPHLTKWQARFRRWYDKQLKKYDDGEGAEVLYPQQIQAEFPQFQELKVDMERVNQALMRYRAKMRELVMTE
ncbi:MAG TPA: hypothetical protein VMG08_04595 [Allosphingosinicella sp.]|nr:hypothetical protein [Allosphingosinicella sp.]